MTNPSDISWKRISAEAAAIVGSILLAFAIDAGWQDRQDKVEERELLAGLRIEFSANRVHLAEVIANWTALSDSAESLHRLLRDWDSDEGDTLVRLRSQLERTKSVDPRTGQLNSLISSGKLGLIRNPELRAQLADWPDLVTDLSHNYDFLEYRIYREIVPIHIQFFEYWDDSNRSSDIDGMRSHRELDNLYRLTAGFAKGSISEAKSVIDATNLIITNIDRELTQ